MIWPVDIRVLLVRIGLCAILGGAVFSALLLVGRAPGETARLKAQRQAEASLRSLPTRTQDGPYSPGAICRLALASEATVLKARLSNAAAAAGVNIGEINFVASPAGEGQRLSSIHVRLESEGPYLSALAFLRIIAEGDPTLFVDRMRLRRAGGDRADLDIEGRVYCDLGGEP